MLKNGGMNVSKTYPIVLSIAGSDSSGGAGVQADLKTFSSLGVYGATVITAITAQNTQGVRSQLALPAQIVYEQILAVMEDIRPSVVKIGMLSNAEIAHVVADALGKYSIPLILDPVFISTSGHQLLSQEALQVVKCRLLPMAELITPNIPEMHELTGLPLLSMEQKHEAARYLFSLGAKAILLKGGHEEGSEKTDILFQWSDEQMSAINFSTQTISTRNVHGTGCTLSSAIAAYLARGYELSAAVGAAKSYVFEAIKSGAEVRIGCGVGPVNHLFNPLRMLVYEKQEL